MSRTRCAWFAALAAAPAAVAQTGADAAAPLEDRPAATFEEVERGFFVGGEAGSFLLFGPKNCGSTAFAPGRAAGVSAGVDVAGRVSIGVLVLATQSDAPSTFPGDDGCKTGVSGDFSSLAVGAQLRIGLFAFGAEDHQLRTWIYVRAFGAYALLQPRGLFTGNDILIGAGPGVEFFTHLRHFSIGVEADVVFGLSYLQAGVALSPYIRYSF